jgi:hypothetical protein
MSALPAEQREKDGAARFSRQRSALIGAGDAGCHPRRPVRTLFVLSFLQFVLILARYILTAPRSALAHFWFHAPNRHFVLAVLAPPILWLPQ